MNKQVLYIMIGLPASGKSYIAEKISKENDAVVVSSDKIRADMFGSEEEQGSPTDVFNVVHEEILSLIELGENVVFDATNISYKHRRALIQKVKKYKVRVIAVLIATPLAEILKNNEGRERKVPYYVIDRMLKSIYIPFWEEGWDDIDIVWNNRRDMNFRIQETVERLKSFDQENPHHEHSLGDHLLRVAGNLISDGLYLVGILHDIGKEYTKTFKNTKGETTDVAHYYGHDSVSAYLSLFYLFCAGYGKDEIIDVTTRIQFHMRPYWTETEKSKQKLRLLVGDAVYDDLLKINRSDIDAH